MKSEYALTVIRQCLNDLRQNDQGEWYISNRYFKQYQSDTISVFSNWYNAKCFIIDEITKDLGVL